MSAKHILLEEVHFHPTSFCDRNGRLFSWRGDLYRALTPAGAALGRRMFAEGTIARLVGAKLLIDSEMTDLTLDGYESVIKHRRLPFVSLPAEWSPRMLRDAALHIADLELALQREGLGLNENDVAPDNVLFDGCRPVYIDFSSIREAGVPGARVYTDYEMSCVFPLQLVAGQRTRLSRALLAPENGLLLDEMAQLTREPRQISRLDKLMRKILAPLQAQMSPGSAAAADIARLRAEIAQLPMPPAAEPDPMGDATDDALSNLLREFAPETALVVGDSSARWLPALAATGSRIVFVDGDDRVVDREYLRAASDQVLPVVFDLRYPPAGRGVGNREIAPASERFACELVLAVDLVEQCVFSWFLNFDQICLLLASFAQRRVILGFRPPEHPRLQSACADSYFAWYQLENLRQSLARTFREVDVHGPFGEGQFLLSCSR